MRIITSVFLHSAPLHIFFNMYFLYFFGKAVESIIGSGWYLILYIVSGFWAGFPHTASIGFQGASSISIPAVGASGAISGVLRSYLMLYPTTLLSMCLFYIIFPVWDLLSIHIPPLLVRHPGRLWLSKVWLCSILRPRRWIYSWHSAYMAPGQRYSEEVQDTNMLPGSSSWNLDSQGEGLGAAQKAALVVLLISVLAMAGYSYFQGLCWIDPS